MIRYIHGSENSTDVDVVYVFDELPPLNECKKFCSADPTENRNIITISDGIVTNCYKGTIDEINNGLFNTYCLHEQEYPLLVTRLVPRVKPLKYVRSIRVILSHLSRSQYRTEVKRALRSNFTTRLDVLNNIDLAAIDFTTLNNNMTAEDIAKTIAFQIYQTWQLLHGVEIFTKNGEKDSFSHSLQRFLNRDKLTDDNKVLLDTALHTFLNTLQHSIQYTDIDDNTCEFVNLSHNVVIELVHEKIID